MLIVDCPWCDDRMVVDDAPTDIASCETCGVRAEIVSDSTTGPVALAA